MLICQICHVFFKPASINVNYIANPNTIENAYGKEILSICKDFLLVPVKICELHYKDVTCDCGLTNRQKDQWVFQIDWDIKSKNLISQIVEFKILNYIIFSIKPCTKQFDNLMSWSTPSHYWIVPCF